MPYLYRSCRYEFAYVDLYRLVYSYLTYEYVSLILIVKSAYTSPVIVNFIYTFKMT